MGHRRDRAAIDPDWTPPQGGTPTGLAFVCDGPAEVDALYAELTAAGYAGEKPPWDAFWGQRYAVVQDPDGHGVDLFAPLPQGAGGVLRKPGVRP